MTLFPTVHELEEPVIIMRDGKVLDKDEMTQGERNLVNEMERDQMARQDRSSSGVFDTMEWPKSPSREERRLRDFEPDALAEAIKAERKWRAVKAVEEAVEQSDILSNSPTKFTGPLPSIYFDGVQLAALLREDAHEASARSWKLETALRNLRLAETSHERRVSQEQLKAVMVDLKGHSAVGLKLAVDELAKAVDLELNNSWETGQTTFLGPVQKRLQAIKMYWQRTGG